MSTVEQREQASDQRYTPELHYVYILRLADGSFYIGQSNNLDMRVVEHHLDAGALATKGQDSRLVWFSHTHDRESAQQMESRLQSLLERSPLAIEEQVARFSRLLDLVRPQKTLQEMREEEKAHESEMVRSWHWWPGKHLLGEAGWTTACGWRVPYNIGRGVGVEDPRDIVQRHREQLAIEGVGGTYSGLAPCRQCLPLAEAASAQ